MKKFSEVVREIRDESGLSQKEFADKLGVSSIYISKIETDQKEVSKKFLIRLSNLVDIHPSLLAPFLFYDEKLDSRELSSIEKRLFAFGEELQKKLISKRLNR